MMKIIVLSILVNFISSFESEDVSICAGKIATSPYVIEFCDWYGGTIKHRCCRLYDNDTFAATFIAIDLMDSNLTEVPDFSHTENLNLTVIDLRSNPDLEPSKENDFLTLIYLNDLLLPEHVNCPGGLRVWERVDSVDDPKGIRCRNQTDICVNSTHLCDEESSLCAANGPNHFLCLCTSGYYGYKCLRYGTFPTAIFFGSTAGITIFASIFLYWKQRRHVKK